MNFIINEERLTAAEYTDFLKNRPRRRARIHRSRCRESACKAASRACGRREKHYNVHLCERGRNPVLRENRYDRAG